MLQLIHPNIQHGNPASELLENINSNGAIGPFKMVVGFDVDGTLQDDRVLTENKAAAIKEAQIKLLKEGISPVLGGDITRKTIIDPKTSKEQLEGASQYFNRIYGGPEIAEKAVDYKNAYLLEVSKPLDGATEMIAIAVEAGASAYIATNYRSERIMGPIINKHFVQPIKNEFGVEVKKYFDCKKLETNSLELINAEHGLTGAETTPENFIYVGNTFKDIVGCLKAGGTCVLINGKNNKGTKNEMPDLTDKLKEKGLYDELKDSLHRVHEVKDCHQAKDKLTELIAKAKAAHEQKLQSNSLC